ncbi:MAG: hypothetical protein WCU00_11085 [Candidatus Latescibacterota bacterium]
MKTNFQDSTMYKAVLTATILSVLLFQFSAIVISSEKPDAPNVDTSDIASPEGFPAIGKWMFQEDMTKARWLGFKWENRILVEPINVIIIDKKSKTSEEARSTLFENLKKAGYLDRSQHSSGYLGYIGGKFYSQLPQEKHHAFSNKIAEKDNNHGRVFGPCSYKGSFIFIAAFSREILGPISKVDHHYGSFNRARDEFAQSLDKKSAYRIVGFLNLNNFIVNSNEYTTGDHDGIAVVVSLGE